MVSCFPSWQPQEIPLFSLRKCICGRSTSLNYTSKQKMASVVSRWFTILTVIPEDDAEEPPRSGTWTPPAEPEYNADTPPPSPPLPSFAPGGLPVVKKRFRQKPDPLHVQIPQSYTSPTSLRNRYSVRRSRPNNMYGETIPANASG